jgi:hypothetical protein
MKEKEEVAPLYHSVTSFQGINEMEWSTALRSVFVGCVLAPRGKELARGVYEFAISRSMGVSQNISTKGSAFVDVGSGRLNLGSCTNNYPSNLTPVIEAVVVE